MRFSSRSKGSSSTLRMSNSMFSEGMERMSGRSACSEASTPSSEAKV